ncbi:MAG: 2-oxoacid:acceptor oxidoreductase family protein [Syntrophobacterales bacterium]|jgi:2-oxoacid:acceptor oxidoreductase gamma subunit (pyruvate/2-ketoisovalerate family)|nr:2-oxoacid:acceptor oxidoreductase family protein [Syntrophobacterales bacterium]
MKEILWHGRGGQGVVVAAQILAEAAYLAGFKGVTSAPAFGPERRGSPVTASSRIAGEPVRTFSQIEQADVAIVLDDSLFKVVDILNRLKKEGLIIINTAAQPDQVGIEGCFEVATVDAVGIALKHHLIREGAPVFNTTILGAFARATGLVSLEHIERALEGKISRDAVARNFSTVKDAYEHTVLRQKAQS